LIEVLTPAERIYSGKLHSVTLAPLEFSTRDI
jgi:hypothetical protein